MSYLVGWILTNYTKSLFMTCHFPEEYLQENQRSACAKTKWYLSNDLLYVLGRSICWQTCSDLRY